MHGCPRETAMESDSRSCFLELLHIPETRDNKGVSGIHIVGRVLENMWRHGRFSSSIAELGYPSCFFYFMDQPNPPGQLKS